MKFSFSKRTLLILTCGILSASWSQAAVTYMNPEPNISIPITFGGIYINIDTAAENSSSQSGGADAGGASFTISYTEPPSGEWDLNFFFGGAGIAHSPTLQPNPSAVSF